MKNTEINPVINSTMNKTRALFPYSPTRLFLALLYLAILALFLPGQTHATEIEAVQTSIIQPTEPAGQVTLPLEEYQRLLQQATTLPLSAPSSYAVGQSVLNVVFHQRDGHVTATVQAQVEVETFDVGESSEGRQVFDRGVVEVEQSLYFYGSCR